MPEKSLILTDWQARAAADGRLTQVSVPVKPQPPRRAHKDSEHFTEGYGCVGFSMETWVIKDQWRCPYPPGTVLVGKETWASGTSCSCAHCENQAAILYKATWNGPGCEPSKWRSPATMPRWAARFRWTVEAVSVRRVGEMRELEAKAHGFAMCCPSPLTACRCNGRLAKNAFREYWQSHYGKTYPWPDAWVWAVKFKPEKA